MWFVNKYKLLFYSRDCKESLILIFFIFLTTIKKTMNIKANDIAKEATYVYHSTSAKLPNPNEWKINHNNKTPRGKPKVIPTLAIMTTSLKI